MSTPLLPIGSPARVRIRRVVRVQYRLEWERDGFRADYDGELEPTRKRNARHVSAKATAYRMAALRLIFARRDRLATGTTGNGLPFGCSLCDAMPSRGPDDQPMCRYHDGFDVLVKRLARWLRWRDERSFLARSRAWFARLREEGKAA